MRQPFSMSCAIELRRLFDPCNQMIADAQRIRHSCESRVDRPDIREKAGIDDIEVVEFVSLAVAYPAPSSSDLCRNGRYLPGARLPQYQSHFSYKDCGGSDDHACPEN